MSLVLLDENLTIEESLKAIIDYAWRRNYCSVSTIIGNCPVIVGMDTDFETALRKYNECVSKNEFPEPYLDLRTDKCKEALEKQVKYVDELVKKYGETKEYYENLAKNLKTNNYE